MAVTTQNGVTVLTPTAWKWYLGGALIFFLIPPLSFLISIFFFLTGAGKLQKIQLTPQGVQLKNWWSTKSYRWEDIGDFRVQKIKSGLITAASMVSFTHANKEGTMMGKAAKLLAGGTHSIPSVGMPAKKLAQLMMAYKHGYVPENTTEFQVTATQETRHQTPAPMPVGMPEPRPAQRKAQPEQKVRPRAVPATPRASQSGQAFERKSSAGQKKGTPLVQDGGGLFGRRRPSSPFGS